MDARGNVRYQNSSRQENLHAEKFNYNTGTELGTFYDVHGTVGSASQGGARLLTTDNPFYIEGKVVHKTREHYTVYNGFVTNCDVDHPWWTLRAPRTKITPGKSATIYRGVFRLRKVPVFYFPIFQEVARALAEAQRISNAEHRQQLALRAGVRAVILLGDQPQLRRHGRARPCIPTGALPVRSVFAGDRRPEATSTHIFSASRTAA